MAATRMVDAVPAAACGAALKANKLGYQPVIIQKIDCAAIN
jgi:hypothetical protein